MPDDRYDWVTVREAARRLGRSPETIRRQAKDHILEHPWEWAPRSRSDKRLAMFVGFPKIGVTPQEPSPTPHDVTLAPDALRVAVDALQAQIAALKAQYASERAGDASRIARLEQEIGALDETARLLAADALDASQRADAQAARLQAAERERDELRARLARRRWWQWW